MVLRSISTNPADLCFEGHVHLQILKRKRTQWSVSLAGLTPPVYPHINSTSDCVDRQPFNFNDTFYDKPSITMVQIACVALFCMLVAPSLAVPIANGQELDA